MVYFPELLLYFFLPMFFIASGMLFNDTGKSYKETAIRYVKKLMIPFWTMMLIFTVCEMVRAPLLGYGDYSIAVPSIAAAVYGSAMVPDIGVLGILMICAGAVTVIADSLGTINTLWIRCIYGPYGVFSGILAFVAGVCSSYFVLNVCRFFEISLFSPIKKLLSLISIHSMTVYLWHLLIFNVIYALYTMVTEEKLSPDPYMMNLITQSSTLFRFAVVIFTAVLLAYAELLFSRFKKKVY